MLPPLDLPIPYWQESADLVAAVTARFGVEVVVLRMLSVVESIAARGG